MPPNACPICLGSHSDEANVVGRGGGYLVDCPVCGRYAISEEAWEDSLDPENGAGQQLSEMCRAKLAHKVRTGNHSPTSTRAVVPDEFISGFIADGCPGPTPAEQANNIIRFIGDEVSRAGQNIETLPVEFFAIVGAPNPKFAGSIAMELRTKELVDGIPSQAPATPHLMQNVNLTLDGWARYEAEKRGEVAGSFGFIAMQFGDAVLDPFVKGVIKPAVKAGINYDLVDMRDVSRAGIIDNIMRTHIRDSAFVIVDLTHDNAGAYWEAGYAEGLGKPVIYICEGTKFEEAKTHFDTNHCTTVAWSEDDPDQFEKDLIATLRRSLNLF